MRLNVTAADSLAEDGRPVHDRVKEMARTILYARLAPLRLSGVAHLDMHWIASGTGESQMLGVRYHEAKRTVTCRLKLVPTAPFSSSYARDMSRLTIGVLAVIVDRLGQRGTRVDLSRAAAAIARDFAALARRADRYTQ